MRQSIERHFWLPEERRYAPVLSAVDFTPHRAPFAPINLHPLWLGYLSADDPKAASNLEGTLTWLWRSPGLARMTPFVDRFAGTELVVEHIERRWCPTITSDQIIGGEAFRFRR